MAEVAQVRAWLEVRDEGETGRGASFMRAPPPHGAQAGTREACRHRSTSIGINWDEGIKLRPKLVSASFFYRKAQMLKDIVIVVRGYSPPTRSTNVLTLRDRSSFGEEKDVFSKDFKARMS